MSTTSLSPREEQIVGLSIEGLTNDGIANKLGISVGTVNTYWLRIKLKVGGQGRTDTVAKVVKERAEKALRASDDDRQVLNDMLAGKHQNELDTRAALALFHFAMSQIKSTVWATDRDLVIHTLANGEFPSTHFGVKWEEGKTIYDIFKTREPKNLAVDAHLKGLSGVETEVSLTGEFANVMLHVIPLDDESGENIGCISILNLAEEKNAIK